MDGPGIALTQGGWFTLGQARAENFSRRDIDRLTEAGVWRGSGDVRRIAHWPDSFVSRAWRASLVTGGVISGPSAVELHGGQSIGSDKRIHVTVPTSSGWRHLAGTAIHRQAVGQQDVHPTIDPPATTAARAVEDVAVMAGHVATVVAIETLCRAGALTVAEVARRRIGRGPWGTAKVSNALRDVDLRSESCLETELRLLLQPFFPGLQVQYEIEYGTRQFRGDLADEASRLVFEADGRRYHPDEKFEYDHDRRLWLRRAGWTPLEFTARQIRRTPTYVIQHSLAERDLALAKRAG